MASELAFDTTYTSRRAPLNFIVNLLYFNAGLDLIMGIATGSLYVSSGTRNSGGCIAALFDPSLRQTTGAPVSATAAAIQNEENTTRQIVGNPMSHHGRSTTTTKPVAEGPATIQPGMNNV